MKLNLQPGIRAIARVALICALAGVAGNLAGQNAHLTPSPYAAIGATNYTGPARAAAFDLPGDVVRIGILAPLHGPEQADGEAIVLAARLALQKAAAETFPGGRRLELAIADEAGPSWGQAAGALLRLVNQDHVIAVLTSANGATAHLSEQVGNRLGIPILTLSSDPTTTQIDLPWIFRLGPSDSQLAEAILQDIQRRSHAGNLVLVAEGNHDGRVGAREFQMAEKAIDAVHVSCVFIDPDRPDFDRLIANLNSPAMSAMALWTRPEVAGALVERLQKTKLRVPIYLSPQTAQESFALRLSSLRISSETASGKGLWMPNWDFVNAPECRSFKEMYKEKTGHFPSPVASEAYDAVALIAEAFRVAGPNRARVRDWVAGASGYSGVSGNITFDQQGNNIPTVQLVRLTTDERSAWPN